MGVFSFLVAASFLILVFVPGASSSSSAGSAPLNLHPLRQPYHTVDAYYHTEGLPSAPPDPPSRPLSPNFIYHIVPGIFFELRRHNVPPPLRFCSRIPVLLPQVSGLDDVFLPQVSALDARIHAFFPDPQFTNRFPVPLNHAQLGYLYTVLASYRSRRPGVPLSSPWSTIGVSFLRPQFIPFVFTHMPITYQMLHSPFFIRREYFQYNACVYAGLLALLQTVLRRSAFDRANPSEWVEDQADELERFIIQTFGHETISYHLDHGLIPDFIYRVAQSIYRYFVLLQDQPANVSNAVPPVYQDVPWVDQQGAYATSGYYSSSDSDRYTDDQPRLPYSLSL